MRNLSCIFRRSSFLVDHSSFAFVGTFALLSAALQQAPCSPLDPRGKIHIPIGIPNTLDTLKTFVEAEGNFSPGFATYGIYFWVFDPQNQEDDSQLTWVRSANARRNHRVYRLRRLKEKICEIGAISSV